MIAEILTLILLIQQVETKQKHYQQYIEEESNRLLAIDKENAQIDNYIYIEPVKMRVTCYLPTGNHTASGCYPFIGSCAGRKEDIGKVAVLYDIEMNFIGYMEIRDCGGSYTLRNGTSLDIFRMDMKSAKEWIKTYGDYCYVQIIEAEG